MLTLAAALVAGIWAYWSAFVTMAESWDQSPEYSHGYLVPIIAVGLLWWRHDQLRMGEPVPARAGLSLISVGIIPFLLLPGSVLTVWGYLFAAVAVVGAGFLLKPSALEEDKLQPTWWGLPFLLVGVGVRVYAAYFYIEWFDHLSIIPTLVGIVLLTVGWHTFKWAWPGIVFLAFMVPLPHSLAGMMRGPLRGIGTKASTFLMQTVGLPAFAEGNRHEIVVGGMTHRIGVAEACSGLSMLMIFFALSAAVSVVARRPKIERMVVLLSAIPIALVANILRITITGVMLYELEGQHLLFEPAGWTVIDMSGAEFSHSFFHDWAGWLMMPLALGLLWLEVGILRRLFLIEEEAPLVVGLSVASGEAHKQHAPDSRVAATVRS